MSKKVSCLNPIALCGLNLLGDNYEIIEDNNDADAILVRSAQMHDMELSDKLLAVARAGAGVNNIPLEKCAEKGIVVFNTPGANANGVKELVMASMILASRDIVGGIEWVKDNVADENVAKDAEKAKKAFAGTEIAGKKLGIIGLGAIGVLVANAANRLGMEVYGCDPFISVKNALNMSRDITLVNSYDELYAKCDYITVHVPLLDATKGLLNKEAFSKMKDGVILLNFSRDTVCEADAIREALESGKVKKYVVDFPTPETVTLPNTIVTPHLGASTQESEDNCAIMAVNEIKDFIENGNIINSVNFPQCDAGVCDTKGRITICHKNVHSIISKFTGIFGDAAMNIENMVNKSRGDYAYTVLDTSDATNPEIIEKLKEIEGVIRVRIVK
ncbi:MAG: phosphoglycerate dehydrogenase [Eubacterium sp.]|nr:phosphoglycerate dehydrogenase [Eubacterium sp.]